MRPASLLHLVPALLALALPSASQASTLLLDAANFPRHESGLPVGSGWLLEQPGRIACAFETTEPGRYQIALNLRGTDALGEWPRFRLRFNGALLAETSATSAEWRSHLFTAELEPGPQLLELHFLNALADPLQPRSLLVHSLLVVAPGDSAPTALDAEAFATLLRERNDALLAAADQRIADQRTGPLTVVVTDPGGQPIPGIPVRIRLVRHAFDFGAHAPTGAFEAAPGEVDSDWKAFVRERFRSVAAGELMRWSYQQPEPETHHEKPLENLLAWAAAEGLAVHADQLFQEDPGSVPAWAAALPPEDFRRAALQRARTQTRRHRGTIAQWNVIAGILPGGPLRERMGASAYRQLLHETKAPAPSATLSVDAEVLSGGARLETYLQLLRDLLAEGAPLDAIGIQLQASSTPDPRHLQEALDALAELKLPLLVTDLRADLPDSAARTEALATLARLTFAHPAVRGIRFGGLSDPEGHLTPAAGDVERLLDERWGTREELPTDDNGRIETRSYQGDVEIAVEAPGWISQTVRTQLGREGKLVDLTLQPDPAAHAPTEPENPEPPAEETQSAAPAEPEAQPAKAEETEKPKAEEVPAKSKRRSIFRRDRSPLPRPTPPKTEVIDDLDEPIGY